MITLLLDLGVWSVVKTTSVVKWMIWGSDKSDAQTNKELLEKIDALSNKVDALNTEIHLMRNNVNIKK